MAENETNVKGKKAKVEGDGFNGPVNDDGRIPDHINPDTLMAKGIDPDVGLITVNRQVLQKQHGEKKGADLYRKIAVAGGFYDPQSEPSGSEFYPDLSLEGMDKNHRAKVDAILSAAKE